MTGDAPQSVRFVRTPPATRTQRPVSSGLQGMDVPPSQPLIPRRSSDLPSAPSIFAPVRRTKLPASTRTRQSKHGERRSRRASPFPSGLRERTSDADATGVFEQMCDDVVARFGCAPVHEARGEDPLRFKHHVRCPVAMQPGGILCAGRRDRVHILQEDEEARDCAECRKETPPGTP